MRNLEFKNCKLISKTAKNRLAVERERERALVLKAEKEENNGVQNTSSFYVAKNNIKIINKNLTNDYANFRREIPKWNGSSFGVFKTGKQKLRMCGGCRGEP